MALIDAKVVVTSPTASTATPSTLMDAVTTLASYDTAVTGKTKLLQEGLLVVGGMVLQSTLADGNPNFIATIKAGREARAS